MAQRQRKKDKPKRYTGDLARPLPPLPNRSDPRYEAESAARQEEISRRVKLLRQHHGIDSDDPYDLITRLLLAHVPGFREARKAGGRPKWLAYHDALLSMEMPTELEKCGGNVSLAAKRLARREPWKGFVGRSPDVNKKGEAIRRRYYQLDKLPGAQRQEIEKWKERIAVWDECQRRRDRGMLPAGEIRVSDVANVARELGFESSFSFDGAKPDAVVNGLMRPGSSHE